VVLGFNMPGMDGNEVAQVMAKEQPMLPVVICSGYIDEIPESLSWFADALLQKADASGALLSVVERLVKAKAGAISKNCLLYTSPSPRDLSTSRMPSSA